MAQSWTLLQEECRWFKDLAQIKEGHKDWRSYPHFKNVETWINSVHCPSWVKQRLYSPKISKPLDRESSPPSKVCYQFDGAESLVAALRECCSSKDLVKGRRLHAQAQTLGLLSDSSVVSSLIQMHVRCGSLMEARKLLESPAHHPDAACWSFLIQAFGERGEFEQVLELFDSMQRSQTVLDSAACVAGIRACAALAASEDERLEEWLAKGREIHSRAEASPGCDTVAVKASLVEMYSKCGRMDEARKVFGGMLSYSRSSLPQEYVDSGEKKLALEVFPSRICVSDARSCIATAVLLGAEKLAKNLRFRDPRRELPRAKADEVEPVSFLKSEANLATSGGGGGGGGGGNMQNMPPYNGGDRGPGGGGGDPPYNRPPAPRGTGPGLEPPRNTPPGPGYGYPPGNVPPGNAPGNFPQGPAQNFPPGYGGYRPGYNMPPGGPGGAGPPPPGGYRPPYDGFPGSGNMHRPPYHVPHPGPPPGGPPQPSYNGGPPQPPYNGAPPQPPGASQHIPPGGPPQPPYNAGPPQPPYNAGGANLPPYGAPQRDAGPWGGYRPPAGPFPPVQQNRGNIPGGMVPQGSSGGNFAGGNGPGFQGSFPGDMRTGVQGSFGGDARAGVGTMPPPRSPPSWSPPRAPPPGPFSPPGAPVPSFSPPAPSPQAGAGMRSPSGSSPPPSSPPAAGVSLQENRGNIPGGTLPQRSSGGNFAGGTGPGFQGNSPGVQGSSGGDARAGVGTMPPPRSPPSWSLPKAPPPGPSSPPGAPVPSFTPPAPSPQAGAGMRSSPLPASPPAAGVSLGRGDAGSIVEEKARPSSPTIAGGGTVATPAVEHIAPQKDLDASDLRKLGGDSGEGICSELQAIAYAMIHTEPGATIRIVKESRVCDDCHDFVCKLSKMEKRKFICRDNNTLHVYENGECSCGNYW